MGWVGIISRVGSEGLFAVDIERREMPDILGHDRQAVRLGSRGDNDIGETGIETFRDHVIFHLAHQQGHIQVHGEYLILKGRYDPIEPS